MRDRHDLCALGETAQRIGNAMCRLAAYAGVDLVEDHRLAARHSRDGERNARELTAGRRLGDWGERQSGVRTDEERNFVEPGLTRIPLPQLCDELAFAQTYSDELPRHLLGEARSCLPPRSPKLSREPVDISLGGSQRFQDRCSRIEAVVDRLQLHARLGGT